MKHRYRVTIASALRLGLTACSQAPAAEPTKAPAAAAQPTAAAPAGQPTTAPAAPAGQPTAAPKAATDSGKPLVFVDSSEPNSLDPPVGTGPFGSLQYAIFDPLVNHNAKMEPQPGLATSWEVGADKLTWTFKLRSGVKFHDGTPFDANAVKFTIERILDPKTGAQRRSVFTVIKSVEAVDPLTVKMVTTTPFPDLPFLMMDRTGFIVSPTAVQKLGNAEFGLHPVGTGPFKFAEWIPNDHITLDANADYWGGKPKSARVNYRIIPETAARTAALRAGEADIVMNVSPNDLEALKKDSNIGIVQQDLLSVVTSEMRQTKPPFSDKRVRQAMNLAIDRNAIVKDIMMGVGRVADSPAPPGEWGYTPQTPYEYNPTKAKQLLADAGYPNGFDGNLFYVPGRWGGDEQVTQALQAYWQAVGIRIKLQKVDTAGLDEMLARDPDTMAGWTTQQIRTSTYIDYHLYRLFNSEAAAMKGAQRSGFSDPAVDAALAKGRASFDPNERLKAYQEVQQLVWDDAAFVFVFFRQNVIGVRKGVTGLESLPTGDVRLVNATK
jgi:peptide/nickel transport system substrate-binding protein